ncbi:MAG: hypothetical protein H7177_00285 [Rhizobacter sp.]|nr:hypothetical protein [Bacteriovorax sp.]
MKTLLFSLMILATLASCGKSNKVDSNAAAITSVSNPLVINSSQGSALVTAINNPTTSFGQGQLSLGGGSTGTCKTVAYIINYCYSGSVSTGSVTTWNQILASYPTLTYQYSNGQTVRNSDIVVANKQAELAAILNSATSVQSNGYQYYVYTTAGTYVIDIRYPIQAQPSAVQLTNGTSYYFVQAI